MTDNKRKAEAPNNSEKDPERFYCPYPGCNRSFAELWRLKVHYRAPPDIRGSGKERGHGTELTHCPKCGKALKPGKHHVGCSAGRSAPRQHNKRSRGNEDVDGRSDLSPAESAEQPLTAPPLPLPSILPFLETPSASSFNVLPNQYSNSLSFLGFENGSSKHPFLPAGVSAEHPFAGYLGQLDGMQSFHAHAQAVQAAQVEAARAAQALHAAQSASNAAAAAAAAVAAVPNPLLYHHHHHHQQQQHQLLLAANPYMPLVHSAAAFSPPPLLHNSHHVQHHLPLPNTVPMSQPGSAGSSLSIHPPAFASSFESIFDYPDGGIADRPPSPPPLPPDFPGVGGMLFNFKQFAPSKFPHSSLAETHTTDDNLSLNLQQQGVKQEDLGKSPALTDANTDGDLMQILFGLSDDTPASATINLRHSSEDIKSHGCHHDNFCVDLVHSSKDCLITSATHGDSPKDHMGPQCKVTQAQKLDTGPHSPADGFLEASSVLPKVDSAAELLRLPDGLNGYAEKSDAGCMSRLLGLDHELFGLLQ